MYFLYNFFPCLILSEKKILFARIRYLIDFFNKINLIKFFFYIFNKNINPFKSIEFQKFIDFNTTKWRKSKITTNRKSSIILFENFISHPAYSSQNILLTKYLQLFGNHSARGLLRRGDIKGEIIFRSFGIDKFHYYFFGGFFYRCKYIIKSILLLKNIKNIKSLINLRINKIDIGFLTYDSFMRYTGWHTAQKINFKIILTFSEALMAIDFYEKNFTHLNISHFVQSEKNFVPLGIFFQKFLLDKTQIFSKYGPSGFTIRNYTNFNQRHLEKRTISKKLFNDVFKNYKKESIKLIDKKMSLKGTFGHLPYYNPKNRTVKMKLLNKKIFYKIFGWDGTKKIATIFLHHLIDGNYRHGKRKIFKDNYTWAHETIEAIKKNNKINWIVKQHPSEYYYQSKFNFSPHVKEIEKKYPHIRLCPKDLDDATIKKFTDIAITSHGTSGVEFPAYGIPAICVEDSFFTDVKCASQAKDLKHYKQLLGKAHRMTKISKQKIEKAKVFLFIYEILLKNKNLLPPHALNRDVDENNFWKLFPNYIKRFNQKSDPFVNIFKKQLNLKFRHTINFDLYNVKNKVFNDYK
jgi:hypothetical protein